MYKLVTIGGDGGLAGGKKGAFYNTLEEYHQYWESIDIICSKPKVKGELITSHFGNVQLHCSPWAKIAQPFFIARELKKLIEVRRPDLIVVQEYPPFYNTLGLMMARDYIKGIPVSYEILHIVGYPRSADIKEKFYYLLNRVFLPVILKIPDMVRVMNNQVKEFLMELGVDNKKIKIVNAFYIDFDIFHPRQVPKEYDLIFAARLVKNKGIGILIEAAGKIKKSIPSFKLLVIGEGPEKETLKSKIEGLKLGDNVILHGWAKNANEVAELMCRSKIFIMTSYNEGGPRSVMEAMACGLATISTRVGMMNELIRDGENGFLAGWSAEDFTQKAVELINNEKLRRKFSENGIKTVRDFEKKKMIKNYFDNYRNLIENGRNK